MASSDDSDQDTGNEFGSAEVALHMNVAAECRVVVLLMLNKLINFLFVLSKSKFSILYSGSVTALVAFQCMFDSLLQVYLHYKTIWRA